MIDLKTDLDHLDGLAALYLADGLEETGKDIRAAAADLKNLRDYAIQLERNVSEMSAQVQSFKDSAGHSLLNELERFIDRRISERLEIEPNSDEHIRDVLKELINGGDVCVDVDYSNVELEMTLSV